MLSEQKTAVLIKQRVKALEADIVTRSAAHLSLIEIVIGAAVHGFKIPLGGNLLSLNQGAFLCVASRRSSSRMVAARCAYEISGVASVLKSLSPAGQKLGAMLSISMQGCLFAGGILIGGHGLIGQCLGMMLLSLWAFLQPLITLWIAFGSHDLGQLFGFYQGRMSSEISWLGAAFWQILAAAVAAKILVSVTIPFLLRRFSAEQLLEIESKLVGRAVMSKWLGNTAKSLAAGGSKKAVKPFVGALRDLTRPLFLISFILMILFWSIRDPSWSKIVWLSLRPLGVAFSIFYILRSPSIMRWLAALADRTAFLAPLKNRILKANDYLSEILRRRTWSP